MFSSLIAFRPLGVDVFCLGKKFLVYNMVNRNLKIKYRRSVLGLFWTLLSPLAMTCVYYFVFKVILRIQIPHYLAFILCGVIPWAFFSQTLVEGMESISGSWGLLTKVPIPPQVFPWVNALTNLSTLLFSIPILLFVCFFSDVQFGTSLILLPFYFLSLFLLVYFLALTLGLLFVYFKDLRHIMGILLQLWFYATPVLYNESMIPEKYQWILILNPVGRIFTGIHKVMVDGIWPTPPELLNVVVWVLLAFFSCTLFQKYFGREIIENL